MCSYIKEKPNARALLFKFSGDGKQEYFVFGLNEICSFFNLAMKSCIVVAFVVLLALTVVSAKPIKSKKEATPSLKDAGAFPAPPPDVSVRSITTSNMPAPMHPNRPMTSRARRRGRRRFNWVQDHKGKGWKETEEEARERERKENEARKKAIQKCRELQEMIEYWKKHGVKETFYVYNRIIKKEKPNCKKVDINIKFL